MTLRRRKPLAVLALICFLPVACVQDDGDDDDTKTTETPRAKQDRDEDGFTPEQGDCEDRNREVHPGATEVPGDNIDQDCSGADAPVPARDDVDGDGVTVAQGDCDDANRAVHPSAREVSLDGVDSNCDGEELPSVGEDRYAEALGLLDTDMDGAVSLEEFEAACEEGAQVLGTARPGVVQTHATCGGTNSCRGMVLHPWNELYEHDCSGVNGCQGWSCVETAAGSGRTGELAFIEANCTFCHSGDNGTFKVEVPPGNNVGEYVASFLQRPDRRFLATIAFGASGVGPGNVAYSNMPGHYRVLSRAEMDAIIDYLRAQPLSGAPFQFGDTSLLPDAGSADSGNTGSGTTDGGATSGNHGGADGGA